MNDHPPAFAIPALPTSAPFTTHNIHLQPAPALAPPTVPAKRKRSHTSTAPTTPHHLQPYGVFPPHVVRLPDALPPPPQPNARPTPGTQGTSTTSEELHCICGFSHDDGYSIACDDCGRWSHMLCFDIRPGLVPEEWRCWECLPRPVDAKLARRRQEEQSLLKAGMAVNLTGAPAPSSRRRATNKERANTIASAAAPPISASRSTSMEGPAPEEETVDIEDDGRTTYVSLAEDDVPHEATRVKLRLAAQNWRGVSALANECDPVRSGQKVKVTPLPAPRDDVRPPAFTLQTTAPIAGEQLIAPFTSTVIPAAAYMGDPLNGYAHIGMPKPFVHLVPRPFPVALDARMAGDQTRFARSGCRPNAILRPVLCKDKRNGDDGRAGEGDDSGGGRKDEGELEDDPGTLRFAMFALRDLKACEEIVLGWEWDDGSVVHQLPALIEAGARAGPSKMTAHHIERLRLQMQTIVDSLRSNFVTCACGNAVEDCALRLMEAIADGHFPSTPDQQRNRRQANGVPTTPMLSPHVDVNGRLSPSNPSNLSPPNKHPTSLQDLKRRRKERAFRNGADLGPLIGAERGVRTRLVGGIESGGLRGVELVGDGGRWERNGELEPEERERYANLDDRRRSGTDADVDMDNFPTVNIVKPSPQKGDRKGKARDILNGILNASLGGEARWASGSASPSPSSSAQNDSNSCVEEKLPPKMRKRWIHERRERLRSDLKAGKLPADVNDSSESQSQYQTRSAPGLEGEMLDVNGDPGSAQTQAQSGTRAKSPLEPPFKSRRLTETLMGGGDLLSMLGLRQLKEKKLNVDFESQHMPPPPLLSAPHGQQQALSKPPSPHSPTPPVMPMAMDSAPSAPALTAMPTPPAHLTTSIPRPTSSSSIPQPVSAPPALVPVPVPTPTLAPAAAPGPPPPRRPSSLFNLLNPNPVSPLTSSLRFSSVPPTPSLAPAPAAPVPIFVPEVYVPKPSPVPMEVEVQKVPSPPPMPLPMPQPVTTPIQLPPSLPSPSPSPPPQSQLVQEQQQQQVRARVPSPVVERSPSPQILRFPSPSLVVERERVPSPRHVRMEFTPQGIEKPSVHQPPPLVQPQPQPQPSPVLTPSPTPVANELESASIDASVILIPEPAPTKLVNGCRSSSVVLSPSSLRASPESLPLPTVEQPERDEDVVIAAEEPEPEPEVVHPVSAAVVKAKKQRSGSHESSILRGQERERDDSLQYPASEVIQEKVKDERQAIRTETEKLDVVDEVQEDASMEEPELLVREEEVVPSPASVSAPTLEPEPEPELESQMVIEEGNSLQLSARPQSPPLSPAREEARLSEEVDLQSGKPEPEPESEPTPEPAPEAEVPKARSEHEHQPSPSPIYEPEPEPDLEPEAKRSRSVSLHPTPKPPQLTLSIPELESVQDVGKSAASWNIASSKDGASAIATAPATAAADPRSLFDDETLGAETVEEKVVIMEEIAPPSPEPSPPSPLSEKDEVTEVIVEESSPEPDGSENDVSVKMEEVAPAPECEPEPERERGPEQEDPEVVVDVEMASNSGDIAPDEAHPAATTLRLPSPTFSVASSADPAPSMTADDPHPTSAVTARAEPTKARRSMADYKQRKKREREQQAARAVLSPVTPATPLREGLQPNLAVEKEEPANTKHVEPEPPASSGLEEGEVVSKGEDEKGSSGFGGAVDVLMKNGDSTLTITAHHDKSEPKPVTSSGSTPAMAWKTPEMRPGQSALSISASTESSPASVLPPSLQRREPEKTAPPSSTSVQALSSKLSADGDAGGQPLSVPPTLPRAMRSSSTAPLPRAPRSLRDGSTPASPTLSRRSGSPPPPSTASSKPLSSRIHARATSASGSDTLEPPPATTASVADSVSSSSNGKTSVMDSIPPSRATGPLPTSTAGSAVSATSTSTTAAPTRRQPPSGPRALREPLPGPIRGRGPPPRGPLADRDRDRDRDRGRREREYDRSRDIPDSDEERERERDRRKPGWEREREPPGDRYSPQRWGRNTWVRGRR